MARNKRFTTKMECHRSQKKQLQSFLGERQWANSKNSVNVKFVLAALGKKVPDPMQIRDRKKSEEGYEDEPCVAGKQMEMVTSFQNGKVCSFKEVVKLYRELFRQHNDQISIVDISKWSTWERNILSKMESSIMTQQVETCQNWQTRQLTVNT